MSIQRMGGPEIVVCSFQQLVNPFDDETRGLLPYAASDRRWSDVGPLCQAPNQSIPSSPRQTPLQRFSDRTKVP